MTRWLLMAAAMLSAVASHAASKDWRAEVSAELRAFTESPVDTRQHGANLSLSAEVEYHNAWDDGRHALTVRPFVRVDQHDDKRTHADLREAVWTFHDSGFEVRLGVDKVFWGVTEVYHLVDIINQNQERTVTRIVGGCVEYSPVSSTDDIARKLQVQLFPNPFRQQTRLVFDNPDGQVFRLEVAGMNGQLVRTYENIRGSEVVIDGAALPEGMYWYKLIGDAGFVAGKMSVLR